MSATLEAEGDCGPDADGRILVLRMPERPPNDEKLWKLMTSDTDKMSRALRIVSPVHKGRYVHWDKLRHLSSPEGLSHNEWWFALRLRRIPLFKEVPLLDKKGSPFVFGLPDPVPENLHRIDQDAGGTIQSDLPIGNQRTRDRYVISSLIEEATRSSQIEGAATTRRIARNMIRAERRPRDKSEQMILNNYLAMQKIQILKKEPLTPEIVFELHRILTHDTLDRAEDAGRLRGENDNVRVEDNYLEVFHEPPDSNELGRRLDEMCRFANGETPGYFVHPVIRSIILHFWLAYDHPFADGNGRCARALFYWSMLRNKYWLAEFLSISNIIHKASTQYYRAFLHTETDHNDLTYFVLYHLDVITRAIGELHAYLDRKQRELHELESNLRATEQLNHRQRALISHALRHSDARYTVESHMNSHGVVYQTARTDLLDLAERGLLQAGKVGRAWRFLPAPDLGERLLEDSE